MGCKTCGLAHLLLLEYGPSVTLPESSAVRICLFAIPLRCCLESEHQVYTQRLGCGRYFEKQCLVSASVEDSRGCCTKPSVTFPTLIAPILSSPCCSCDTFSPESSVCLPSHTIFLLGFLWRQGPGPGVDSSQLSPRFSLLSHPCSVIGQD